MERESKYSLIINEKVDGSFGFQFQDSSWHKEGCPLTSVIEGPGGFFLPRRFVNFPDDLIEFCRDCKNWRGIDADYSVDEPGL